MWSSRQKRRRAAQRVVQAGGRTLLMVGTPKSAQAQRVVPLPPFLMSMLRARRGMGQAAGYIFSDASRAAEPRTMQRRFPAPRRRAGIEGAHFHTLRHSFATRLLELGVDIKNRERAARPPLRAHDAGILRPQPARTTAARRRSAGFGALSRHAPSRARRAAAARAVQARRKKDNFATRRARPYGRAQDVDKVGRLAER